MTEQLTSEERASTWVVVPAYNEEHALPAVLSELVDAGYSVVVVDDCSQVPVSELKIPPKAFVLRHLINLGQGAALQTGISFALKSGAKEIVTFDSDGQHNAKDIPRLLAPIKEGRADVCLGTRFSSGGSAEGIPTRRYYFLKLAVFFTRLTTGLQLTDTHNGFRAFSRYGASRISITQNRMSHGSQILSEIKSNHLRYLEVPVTIRYTEYSLQKGQRLSNAFNILWESGMEIFRR